VCPQHDEGVLLTPQQCRPATPRAAARLTVSCGRRNVVSGCSTLRNDCSSGLMFGCCGPIFLLSWPFFPTLSKWTLFPSGHFHLVDVISVDVFFQLWTFFPWTYFPWTFFPNAVRRPTAKPPRNNILVLRSPRHTHDVYNSITAWLPV